jgi:hypothetical protein
MPDLGEDMELVRRCTRKSATRLGKFGASVRKTWRSRLSGKVQVCLASSAWTAKLCLCHGHTSGNGERSDYSSSSLAKRHEKRGVWLSVLRLSDVRVVF